MWPYHCGSMHRLVNARAGVASSMPTASLDPTRQHARPAMLSRQEGRVDAMTTDQIIERLEPWLAKHRRPAWRPVVKEGDGPATASKFCGTPWIDPDAPLA